jgi:quercetin dioxygenase-like cupin family protein
MRKKFSWVMLLGVLAAGAAVYVKHARATPASGFSGSTIAVGRFEPFDVFNQFIPHGPNVWLSLQKTKGSSDLYVQNNVWAPGGSTGWHSHPGHSLIVVTAGSLRAYEGDDRGCRFTEYTPGMGFVDPGGDHVHNIRNEGTVEARTIAVQLIPANAVRRVDVPNPGNCPF